MGLVRVSFLSISFFCHLFEGLWRHDGPDEKWVMFLVQTFSFLLAMLGTGCAHNCIHLNQHNYLPFLSAAGSKEIYVSQRIYHKSASIAKISRSLKT